MKREEILEKSREENGGQDLFEKEVLREDGELGIYMVYITAALFCLISIFLTGRAGYDLWAMAHTLLAVGYTVRLKECRRKRWQDITLVAVLWGAILLNSAMHFRNLLTAAVIL